MLSPAANGDLSSTMMIPPRIGASAKPATQAQKKRPRPLSQSKRSKA
jgi:hypothetical protein